MTIETNSNIKMQEQSQKKARLFGVSPQDSLKVQTWHQAEALKAGAPLKYALGAVARCVFLDFKLERIFAAPIKAKFCVIWLQ